MCLKHGIRKPSERGYSLIEVMITMFIIAIGLLGLAGLQARALNAEIEAASRGQALALANDLAERMAANLAAVKNPSGTATYNMHSGGTTTVFDSAANTLTVYGTGSANTHTTAAGCAGETVMAVRDLCEWDLALKGISEASSGGAKIGAMSGARGCVFQQAASVYEVDVVWQGRDATGAVASDLTCGSTAIASKRRGVSRRIRVADLDA
jgi:type IV pilus assembly protein PilV